MSDFSEICPLFSTGMFKEVTFPAIGLLSAVTISANLLGGTGDPATAPCDFKFSRRVIVTNAYMRRYSNAGDVRDVTIGKRVGSGTAVATSFGTFTVTSTVNIHDEHCWKVAGGFTATTMEAADVLNISQSVQTATANPEFDIIVRYKEA